MSLYQDIILDHYRNPHNKGSLNTPTVSADVNNPLCGDVIHMEVVVDKNHLIDIAFTGSGCAISQASASLLTDYVKGKSIRDIQSMQRDTILQLLGIELSPNRLKCGLLPLEALHRALEKLPIA